MPALGSWWRWTPAPFHSSLLDTRHDALRRERLRSAGFSVISVTDRDLFHAPQDLHRRLRAAYHESRAA